MKFIKIPLFVTICTLVTFGAYAEMTPVPGIEPSGTVPIIYINRVSADEEIVKDDYIWATAWMDASMTENFENIGKESKPVDVQIKGRGNASWLADGPKPYKLKFDKKQDFFGLVKNKHWVLLPVRVYPEYFSNYFGLKLGELLGMPYLPQRELVDLVLDGTYVGLYMLSEHLRVDEGRVDIWEQPELNEIEETIPYGWLVELDNYDDEFQVKIPQPNDYTMRVTHATPEVVNDLQRDWLIDQFTAITETVYTENKLSRDWENYIDLHDWARHFLVMELLHNFDGYIGSCYLHKDLGQKTWHFGPLWDLAYSLDSKKETLMCETFNNRYVLAPQIIKFPRFREAVNDIYNSFMEEYGTDWIDEFNNQLIENASEALTASQAVWPDLSIDTAHTRAARLLKDNIEYVGNRLSDDLRTFAINIRATKIDEDGEDDTIEQPEDGEDDTIEQPEEGEDDTIEQPEEGEDDAIEQPEEGEDDTIEQPEEGEDDAIEQPEEGEDTEQPEQPEKGEDSGDVETLETDSDVVIEEDDNIDDEDIITVLVDGLELTDPRVNLNQTVTLTFGSTADRKVAKLLINGVNCTEDIVNNEYRLEKIDEDKEIAVIFYKKYSGVLNEVVNSNVRVVVEGKNIVVNGNGNVAVYNTMGQNVCRKSTSTGSLTVPVAQSGVYIVVVNNTATKVIVR